MNWYVLEQNEDPTAEPLFWGMDRGFVGFGQATPFRDDVAGGETLGMWVPEEVAVRLATLWQMAQLADGVGALVLSAGYGVVA